MRHAERQQKFHLPVQEKIKLLMGASEQWTGAQGKIKFKGALQRCFGTLQACRGAPALPYTKEENSSTLRFHCIFTIL